MGFWTLLTRVPVKMCCISCDAASDRSNMMKTGLQNGPSHSSYPWLSRTAKYMLEARNGVQTRSMPGKQLNCFGRFLKMDGGLSVAEKSEKVRRLTKPPIWQHLPDMMVAACHVCFSHVGVSAFIREMQLKCFCKFLGQWPLRGGEVCERTKAHKTA